MKALITILIFVTAIETTFCQSTNISTFLYHNRKKADHLFSIEQAKALNSPHSDYAATYYKNEIVFASTRDNDLFIKRKSISSASPEESLSHLYAASYSSGGNYGSVSSFKKEQLKTTLHDGPVAFYHNGRKAAITSNNFNGQNLIAGSTKTT